MVYHTSFTNSNRCATPKSKGREEESDKKRTYLSYKRNGMPILNIVLIITVALIGICLLLPLIDKKHKRKKAGLLFRLLSQAGSKHNLSFSSQYWMNEAVMGLDGINRKLMMLIKNRDGSYKEILIH